MPSDSIPSDKKFCTVYLGCSLGKRPQYLADAEKIGELLAKEDLGIVYGGSLGGCMGGLADAALANDGVVVGIFPDEELPLEFRHEGITKLIGVPTMSQRKKAMVYMGHAFVALPGGPGTFEEITEVISWKRIGLHSKPIFLLNTDNYYAPLQQLFENAQEEGFLDVKNLFELVGSPQELMDAIRKKAL